jgi:hypothetical protein
MLRRQALLQLGQNLGQITIEQRRYIELKAGQDFAADYAVLIKRQGNNCETLPDVPFKYPSKSLPAAALHGRLFK